MEASDEAPRCRSGEEDRIHHEAREGGFFASVPRRSQRTNEREREENLVEYKDGSLVKSLSTCL